MSQSEFARALGWTAATVSRWERGLAQPSRLAFKTILAFAEERGVRYRPRAAERALVPLSPGTEPQRPAPTTPSPGARFVSIAADRPGWSAEASFRVRRVGPPSGTSGPSRSLRAAVGTAAVLGAFLCAAFALGLPGSLRHRPARPVTLAGRAATAPAPAATDPAPAKRGLRRPAPPTPPAVAPELAPPPAVLARLEGVVLLGPRRTATFRTPDEALTVAEGAWLGTRQIRDIAADAVTLAAPHGETRTVRVGDTTPLD